MAETGMQSGGYASYGQHLLGEAGPEFVMSNPLTRLAEKAIGGRLNQQNLAAALQMAAQNNTFNIGLQGGSGALSYSDKQEIVSMTLDGLAFEIERAMVGVA
jgi:hypothetical protein